MKKEEMKKEVKKAMDNTKVKCGLLSAVVFLLVIECAKCPITTLLMAIGISTVLYTALTSE